MNVFKKKPVKAMVVPQEDEFMLIAVKGRHGNMVEVKLLRNLKTDPEEPEMSEEDKALMQRLQQNLGVAKNYCVLNGKSKKKVRQGTVILATAADEMFIRASTSQANLAYKMKQRLNKDQVMFLVDEGYLNINDVEEFFNPPVKVHKRRKKGKRTSKVNRTPQTPAAGATNEDVDDTTDDSDSDGEEDANADDMMIL